MNNYFDKKLGSILKEYRKSNNLSLQDVADKIGVTRQMVFVYESGKTPLTVTQLIKICDIYGIDYVTVLKQVQIEMAKLWFAKIKSVALGM